MYEICLFFSSKIYVFFCVCRHSLHFDLISRAESQRNRMWCCSSTKIVEDLMNFQKKASREKFRNQKPKISQLKSETKNWLVEIHLDGNSFASDTHSAFFRLLDPQHCSFPFVESAKFFKLWNDCMCFYPPNLPFKLSHPTLLWGFVRKGLCHEGWPHQKRVKGWKHLCTNFTIRFVQKGTRFEKHDLHYSFAWICAETRATLMSDCPSDGHCGCRPVQFQLLHELWNRSGCVSGWQILTASPRSNAAGSRLPNKNATVHSEWHQSAEQAWEARCNESPAWQLSQKDLSERPWLG